MRTVIYTLIPLIFLDWNSLVTTHGNKTTYPEVVPISLSTAKKRHVKIDWVSVDVGNNWEWQQSQNWSILSPNDDRILPFEQLEYTHQSLTVTDWNGCLRTEKYLNFNWDQILQMGIHSRFTGNHRLTKCSLLRFGMNSSPHKHKLA